MRLPRRRDWDVHRTLTVTMPRSDALAFLALLVGEDHKNASLTRFSI